MLQVLITGGNSGIGKHLALHYLAEGNTVHIVSKKRLDARQINKIFGKNTDRKKMHVYQCNLNDRSAIRKLSKQVEANTKKIDVLVNNAGFATYETFEELSFETAMELSDVNFTGQIATTLAFRPLLFQSERPHLVFICSIASHLPITPNSIYGAAKTGLSKLGEVLQLELASKNLVVSNVYPGRVETPFFDHHTFKTREMGTETRLTSNVEQSCKKIYRSLKKRKSTIYVPGYWRIFAWLYAVDNFIFGRVLRVMMKKRLKRLL